MLQYAFIANTFFLNLTILALFQLTKLIIIPYNHFLSSLCCLKNNLGGGAGVGTQNYVDDLAGEV